MVVRVCVCMSLQSLTNTKEYKKISLTFLATHKTTDMVQHATN